MPAEVERLCQRLDEELGPKGRRLMYVHMLAQREPMLRLQQPGRAAVGGSRAPARLAARRSPGARLGIRPGIEVEDEAAVWRELDFVAELLADGRPHLCGSASAPPT